MRSKPFPEGSRVGAGRWSGSALLALVLLVLPLAGCTSGKAAPPRPAPTGVGASGGGSPATSPSPGTGTPSTGPARPVVAAPFQNPLPGMPPVIDNDVYAATRAGQLAAAVRRDPAYLYVPDSGGTKVTVISQRTHKVVRVLQAGQLSQHVTPTYDLRQLYVNSSAANKFVRIDPRTARVRGTIGVPRPYNLYFTPDGRQAIVMVEQHNVIRFANPTTFKTIAQVSVAGCRGPNHADFSGNGRFMIVTCEFSGVLLKVSVTDHKVLGLLHLGAMSMPQDIRISPDARTFYVAEMGNNRLRMISATTFGPVGAIATPKDPHGLYPSRDGKLLYVSDRGAGKVSVVSFATHRVVATWTIPHGGSPDMGGVSADGRVLWLSGRYNGEVYGFATASGKLIARIHVGGSPHGLAVWPQPGRYSLGHTGNMR